MYAKFLLAVALCCAPAFCARADEGDNQFAAATAHYNAQRWQQAADAFASFAREFPGHPKHAKAMFFEGQSLVQLERYADAYPVFIELLADEPNGPLAKQSLFRAGETAYLSGNFDEAKIRLLQFQTLYPRDKMNADVLMYEAELAVRAGDTAEARRLYRQSIEHFPDEQPADQCRIALAHLLDLEKQSDAAEVLWREASGHDHSPWAEMALLRLAGKAQAANRWQQALEFCEAVVQRFPNSPMVAEAQLGRGRALVQLGRYADAQKILATLTGHKEFGNDARYLLAQAQKEERQHPNRSGALSAAPKIAANQGNAAASTSSRQKNDATARLADKIAASATPAEQSTPSRKSDERPAPLELAQPQTAADIVRDQTPADNSSDEHRQMAATQYQTAEKFVRSGDYGRAITILQSTDKQASDAPSLANRYLLAVALQGARRTDESLTVLNEVNVAAGRTLKSLAAQSGHSASNDFHADEDRNALLVLRTNILLARATALVGAERFEEAIEPLQSYLATGRQDVSAERAQSALAICFARTKRFDESRKALDDLRSAHPASLLLMPASAQVAEVAFTAGQHAVAAELFTSLASDGNPPEIITRGLAGLGYSRAGLGDYSAADRAFAKLLDSYPTDPCAADVSLARGQALEHLQREAAAAAVYKQAIARFEHAPQLPALLLAQARLQARLGQHEEAVGIYQRIVRDYPNNPQIDATLYCWAWALRDLGRGAEADKFFRRLHDDHPESGFWPDATFRLAERANERGDTVEAQDLLAKLAGDCPAGVCQHALYLQGQMAIAQKNWSEAEKPLEKLVIEFPDSSLRTAAQFWLGEAAYRQDNFQAAQPRFEALAASLKNQKEPWTAVVPLRRAQILVAQKKWNEAARLAESVGRDFPNFEQQHEADYVIGCCRMAQGDLEGTRAALMRVTRSAAGGKTETAAMAQCMIGDTYYQQENYSAALREYLRVEILHPYPQWQAAALVQAGKCHERLGQTKEAAEMYAHVREKYPQTEYTADVSQGLQETKRR